jgi:hypothetical protein
LIAPPRDAWNVYIHAPSSVETGDADGDDVMPQIWMTYDEIAALLGCSADGVRAEAVHRSLDRKKSRDGLTRVKLDSDWTAHFITAVRANPALDQAIRDLQTIRSEMARDAGKIVRRQAAPHQPNSPSSAAGKKGPRPSS